MTMQKVFPCLEWLGQYERQWLYSDLTAAGIVTIMLIPQSLAYAILAGLPPEYGLYASILPLVAYTLFGTSRTLAVGPVAVASLMTAAAIQSVSNGQSLDPTVIAAILALLSGILLVTLGIFRFGFLANFLSHPVVSGFITASGVLIGLSQLRHVLGINAEGDNLIQLVSSLLAEITEVNPVTCLVGFSTLIFLLLTRRYLAPLLISWGLNKSSAGLIGKSAPAVAVVATTLIAYLYNLDQSGVALVGAVPSGLPSLQIPVFDATLWQQLLMPAVYISIIGYVESISVGKTLAARRRQKINSDQELIGLGAANIASSFSGGFPVTGGFSRSVVNFDAGAETPAAGIFTAIGIALSTVFLTDALTYLPRATLAATIIVAVGSLLDFSILKKTWRFSRSDFIAVLATLLITLLAGVELGVLSGVSFSIALHLIKTTHPHIAEVGKINGTEHFRNIKRHQVITDPEILTLRMDESLFFANASVLEEYIFTTLAERKEIRHVILMCNAINEIDISALEVLESINETLKSIDIGFHLSEVKGPVMDALEKTNFLKELNGRVFLSQNMAFDFLVSKKTDETEQFTGSK